MNQIKPRIIFKIKGEQNPIFSTDFDIIKQLNVPGEGPLKDFHEIAIGTIITLNNYDKYEITGVSTDFFDTEYSNDGISMNNLGERYSYNFEVVYKIRKV
ncbi:hypothetical protein ACFLU5_17150 [Bacteroidota bacterium]